MDFCLKISLTWDGCYFYFMTESVLAKQQYTTSKMMIKQLKDIVGQTIKQWTTLTTIKMYLTVEDIRNNEVKYVSIY